MAPPIRRTDDEIEAALIAERGLISYAAKRLGYSFNGLRERIAANPERFNPILREAREAMIDLAERSLHAKLDDGDLQATTFALRTLGRSRGYAERTELTGADGGPLEVADARPALAARLAALAGAAGTRGPAGDTE